MPEGMERETWDTLFKDWERCRRRLPYPSQQDIYSFLIEWFYVRQAGGSGVRFLRSVHGGLKPELLRLTGYLWDRESEVRLAA